MRANQQYGQSSSANNRSQAEVKQQLEYEYRLREQARQTLTWLRSSGRIVTWVRSGDSVEGNRGVGVLPVPRLTDEGQLAWTVR